jgi:hypothetical protein
MTLSTSTMERAHDELMDDAPSLPAKPERRRFSAAYKLAMLDKYDACTGDGDKGALLRREGLYSSQITEWRRSRDAGALVGLRTQPHREARPLSAELARATRRAERAEAKLAKAQKVIEIQGKVSEPEPRQRSPVGRGRPKRASGGLRLQRGSGGAALLHGPRRHPDGHPRAFGAGPAGRQSPDRGPGRHILRMPDRRGDGGSVDGASCLRHRVCL